MRQGVRGLKGISYLLSPCGFPALRLKLWSSRITSIIGIPIHMDKATASGERLSYARCFIEVSATQKLPNSVLLQLEDGEEIEVEVEYEWQPPKCNTCSTFGHVPSHCPTKPAWKHKGEEGDVVMGDGKENGVGMGGRKEIQTPLKRPY